MANNKNILYKTLDYWSRDMLNLNVLEKGLGLVSPSHFVYDFSRKCFSCYILSTGKISLSVSTYLMSVNFHSIFFLFCNSVVVRWWTWKVLRVPDLSLLSGLFSRWHYGFFFTEATFYLLTFSWWCFLSYRNQIIDL